MGIGCVLGVASLSSQNSPDPGAFQQVLRTYRTGRAQEAVNELAAWPADRLAAAAIASLPTLWSLPTLSSSDCMAAADLYAEVANAMLLRSWPYVSPPGDLADRSRQTREVLKVINSALALLYYPARKRGAPPPPDPCVGRAPFGKELGEEPRRSWYYVVANVLFDSYRGQEALSLLDIGLEQFPNDPLLLTARGTIRWRRSAMEGLLTLNAAIADYKQAIKLAPDLAIARLRLAQLYVERGSARDALPLVQAVAAGVGTDNQQYLAHLLLGRIAANEHKLEESAAEYRRAYSIGAGYQAACIAVSRSEEAREHQERAAEVAEECFGLSGHDDPWPHYRARNDPDALPHLRAEARGR